MVTAFDGQSHSTRSDGSLEPAEVVARAAAAGVEVLALTDHDTVAGVGEALAGGRRLGVRVVPAVELTAVDGAHDELHAVAYPAHDRAQTHLLDDLVGELGLLATAASDFHGPEHERFSRFLVYETYGRQPRLGGLG